MNSGRMGKEEGKKEAGKNYLDFFWMRKIEVLTLASKKRIICHRQEGYGGEGFFEIMK
jgi:hypothetical protein